MKANTWIRNCFILAKDSRSRNRNWFSYETQVTVHWDWSILHWYLDVLWCMYQEEIWFAAQNKYKLPQTWWSSALELELRFPLKWNMETSRNKYNSTFPQTWWSESAILQRFWTFPDTLWRKNHPETHPEVNSCAWESQSIVSYMFGAR